MNLQEKTAFVTGATGFLGGALVHRLIEDGVKVRALARRENRDGYIRDLDGVEIVMGNLSDAERMKELVAGCDVVFHVAAATGGAMDKQRETNVEGTRNVMNAAAETRIERVIHVSSIAVYGYRVRTDVGEDMPLNPGADPYPITKVEGENIVREICKQHDLDYSIIRPGMIHGPRSSYWTRKMFKRVRQKPSFMIGNGKGAAYPIYVDDVVDLMIVLATHPAAVGEAFNCTPDPSPTMRDYLGGYAALAGHNSFIGLPVFLLLPAASLLALFSSKHSTKKDIPDLLSHMQRYITYRMEKADRLLDWRPKVSLEAGIQRSIPYLREKGLLE